MNIFKRTKISLWSHRRKIAAVINDGAAETRKMVKQAEDRAKKSELKLKNQHTDDTTRINSEHRDEIEKIKKQHIEDLKLSRAQVESKGKELQRKLDEVEKEKNRLESLCETRRVEIAKARAIQEKFDLILFNIREVASPGVVSRGEITELEKSAGRTRNKKSHAVFSEESVQ